MASNPSIEEVARRTGLTARTLRDYERIGLIAPVARAPGGQRRQAAEALAAKVDHYRGLERSPAPDSTTPIPERSDIPRQRPPSATSEASPGCARSTARPANRSSTASPTSRPTSRAT